MFRECLSNPTMNSGCCGPSNLVSCSISPSCHSAHVLVLSSFVECELDTMGLVLCLEPIASGWLRKVRIQTTVLNNTT